MADLFPIFLKLDGRPVLVVGAGKIAEQKLESLLRAGARIHVVAPEASGSIEELARAYRLRWSQRAFQPNDVAGQTLIVAATGDPEVNESVFRAAEEYRVLCNAVDEPERCHFYYPAVVQRGDLQIAISTAGHSPALAQRIRKELEQQFDAAYGDWLRWLGSVRQRLFSHPVDPHRRKAVLHRIARSDVYERFSRLRAKQSGASQ